MGHDFGTFVACRFILWLSADVYFDVVSRQPEAARNNWWVLQHLTSLWGGEKLKMALGGTPLASRPHTYLRMTLGHMCRDMEGDRTHSSENPLEAACAHWEMVFPCRAASPLCTHTSGACVLRALENCQPNALTQAVQWAVLRLLASDLGGSCHLRGHRGCEGQSSLMHQTDHFLVYSSF